MSSKYPLSIIYIVSSVLDILLCGFILTSYILIFITILKQQRQYDLFYEGCILTSVKFQEKTWISDIFSFRVI